MIDLFVVFWTLAIFTSICWYGALIFYIGKLGARDIKVMTKALEARGDSDKKP
jgi:hypothetical protein